jgi:hypothetical protein
MIDAQLSAILIFNKFVQFIPWGAVSPALRVKSVSAASAVLSFENIRYWGKPSAIGSRCQSALGASNALYLEIPLYNVKSIFCGLKFSSAGQ